MAKDLPVTLDGKVIYHIKLTDSFQGLAEELKQLGYQAEQKICIISDSNVAKLYAETVKNILTKSFPQIFRRGKRAKIQIPSMVFMNF